LMKNSFAVLIVAELETMQEGVHWVLNQDAEAYTKDNVHSVSGCSTRHISQ